LIARCPEVCVQPHRAVIQKGFVSIGMELFLKPG